MGALYGVLITLEDMIKPIKIKQPEQWKPVFTPEWFENYLLGFPVRSLQTEFNPDVAPNRNLVKPLPRKVVPFDEQTDGCSDYKNSIIDKRFRV